MSALARWCYQHRFRRVGTLGRVRAAPAAAAGHHRRRGHGDPGRPVLLPKARGLRRRQQPEKRHHRRAYDLLAEGFGPGYNGPLQVVAKVPTARAATDFTQLEQAIKTQPGVVSVLAGPAVPGATVRTLQITPATSPQSAPTTDLIDTLRHQVIPAYEQNGLTVYVGGQTTVFKDFSSVLGGKLPLFIFIVVLLGALLLMLAFRSLLIPLTAAAMNLLSAGAAFGVVVAVFQWGWGSSALGAGTAGPIESFLPAMMLAILFGLSMDYEVFLVSRIREEWLRTSDNNVAVRRGQAATGRVITAAAVIMICVFMAFVFGGSRVIAEFGVGLAAAILLDALVVRTILVPALMQLFGRANWYLPQSIERILPHVSVEGPPFELAHVEDRELGIGHGGADWLSSLPCSVLPGHVAGEPFTQTPSSS